MSALRAQVAAAARRLGLSGRPVLVAVSGGLDSTALCHALHAERERIGCTLCVAHVNHGLRGTASDADEEAVRALADRLGLPFRARRVDPEALRADRGSRTRPTLQEAARRVRYEALREMAAEAGATRVATAHTLDDQAETVLLRLLRGTGPDGLAGIPERSADGIVVRPLLATSRAEIELYARREGLSWREDESNRDPRFGRGWLRRSGWAELASERNPRWLRAVADLAEAQNRDAEWIAACVDEEAKRCFASEGDALRIARHGFAELPEALARRLAREALRRCGASRDVSRTHLLRVVEFLRRPRSGRRIELPGGLLLVCDRDAFRLRAVPVTRRPRC